VFKPLGDAMRAMGWLMSEVSHLTGFATRVGGVFSKISGMFSGIFNEFTRIVSKFGWVSKAFGVLGRVLGKIFIPLNILISIWEAATGFIEGFADFQGPFLLKVLNGFTQGAKNLLGWLIVMPLDLLKDLVSWVAGQFGWTNIVKILDNFSFGDNLLYPILDFLNLAGQFVYVGLRDVMTNLWSGVKFVFGRLWGWVSSIFTDPVGALKSLWSSIFQGMNTITDVLLWPINSAINWVMEKFGWKSEDAPDFSLKDFVVGVITDVWKDLTSIFDSILNFDWFGLMPDWAKSLFADDIEKAQTKKDPIKFGLNTNPNEQRTAVVDKPELGQQAMLDVVKALQGSDRPEDAKTVGILTDMIRAQASKQPTIVIAPSTTDASTTSVSQSNVNVKPNAGRGKIDPAAGYNPQPAF